MVPISIGILSVLRCPRAASERPKVVYVALAHMPLVRLNAKA